MEIPDCLFCRIVAGYESKELIWEDEEFICIKNKYPVAPVHVLVLPKSHIRKQEVSFVTTQNGQFWGKILLAVFSVVRQLGLEKTGYKLVNNGAGYNHFEHEHVHILGGSAAEPGGTT